MRYFILHASLLFIMANSLQASYTKPEEMDRNKRTMFVDSRMTPEEIEMRKKDYNVLHESSRQKNKPSNNFSNQTIDEFNQQLLDEKKKNKEKIDGYNSQIYLQKHSKQ